MKVSSFLRSMRVKGESILPFYFLLFTSLSFAQTTAPGAPGQDAEWLSAAKQAIGTSANPESKVWFTLANGVLTEVMYPNVQTANVQMLQFVVVNPKTKKVETEWDDMTHVVSASTLWDDERRATVQSLSFEQESTSKSGDFKIFKRFVTDPTRNVLQIRLNVRFLTREALQRAGDYKIYVVFDPSLANSGLGDTAWTQDGALLAQDGNIFSAVVGRPTEVVATSSSKRTANGFLETTNGLAGISDGLTDLLKNQKLSSTYTRAENGNVVQVARLEMPKTMFRSDAMYTLALGFGDSANAALTSAKESLNRGFSNVQSEYEEGWKDFVQKLPQVDLRYRDQFNMAAMVVKALEDKSARGGNVASLSVPWGGGGNGNTGGTGYRMVWSRDLYHVFTAFLAIGDMAAAERALDFLFKVQQQPDGSFPQNSGLNGKDGWGSLQMDEVGYPLVMAWQLGRFDKDTWGHVKKSADFIVAKGPFSPQERWEERPGYSPSTIAAQIAGLVCAAEIAKRNGDTTSAEKYLKTADEWEANVEKWTATTKGKYGDGNYYLRISEKGEPDGNHKIELNNNAGTFYEHEIVDAGFLELVRFGIKPADDPLIVKSLKVVDQLLKVDTPSGPAFRRYTHDGYGEMDDGRRWNWDRKYTGRGRPWPLLSGERGQYELALQNEYVRSLVARSTSSDGRPLFTNPSKGHLRLAQQRLDHMLGFASESLMLPEQIWDKATISNTDRRFVPELRAGKGTGSATPLAWSMAAFIRLATNLKAGINLDTPQIVYDRYVKGIK